MAENSPAESRRAEHARCQPLLLNLMPLSLPPPPPPVESNLAERQKRAPVTATSTAVCFQLGGRTTTCLCVSVTQAPPPVVLPPSCARVSRRYCQSHGPTMRRLITPHHSRASPRLQKPTRFFKHGSFSFGFCRPLVVFPKIPLEFIGILFFFPILH